MKERVSTLADVVTIAERHMSNCMAVVADCNDCQDCTKSELFYINNEYEHWRDLRLALLNTLEKQ
jgi:hypothetical protein